ncbi:MAG: type II secretion system F family protein [Candidatus Micrarchaeota archaeon]
MASKSIQEIIQQFYQKILDNSYITHYANNLKRNKINVNVLTWLGLAFGASIAFSIISFFLLNFFGFDNPLLLSIIVLFVLLDLSLGYPYYLEMRRIEEIERLLPDALKQIADTLKAGGTYEFALRELVQNDFGPLTRELELVLRKLDEGENLENSFKSLAENNDSRLLKRATTIIVDSIKSGAGLAEILDQISDDIRELKRIDMERKARTTMGIMLLAAAGAIVAPGLFGLNSSVLTFLIATASKTSIAQNADTIAASLQFQNYILFVVSFYIFLEVTATSIMISLMRNGKAGKSIIYAPILLFLAFVIYYTVRFMAGFSILKGA